MVVTMKIFENFIFILILVHIYTFYKRHISQMNPRLENVLVGLGFGLVGLASMQYPISIVPGYMIDARTIMIVLAGYFSGPIGATIAALIVALFRTTLGGSGLIPAVMNMVIAAIIGSVFYRYKSKFRTANRALLCLGFALAVGSTIPIIFIPYGIWPSIVKGFFLPLLVIMPFTTYIFATIIIRADERYKMEMDLKELNYDLENIVLKRTRELETLNLGLKEEIKYRNKVEKQLSEAMEKAGIANKAKSEFLANMSHEIRTPLNALMGFTHMLRETELTDKQLNYLNKMKSSSASLINVINDILDFSKIEAGKIDLIKQPFNLFDTLNDLVDTISYELNKKGLSLYQKIDRNIPEWVIGDPGHLSQILLNIMANGVKFTHSGHIALTITCAKNEHQTTTIRFCIEDTGIGVKREHLEGLFDAFVQANMTINREFGGTGLGLAITYQLVQLMGGVISFKSEYGEGSVVTVDLPFEKAHQKVQRFEQATNVVLFSNHKNFEQPLKHQLMRMDANVRVIKSINQLHKGESIDCVIIDLNQRVTSHGLLYQLIGERVSSDTQIMFACYSRTTDSLQQIESGGEGRILFLPKNSKTLMASLLKSQVTIIEKDAIKEKATTCVNPLKDHRVLVVEDNPLNQDIQSSILLEKEMIVTIAENGQVAIEHLKNQGFDIVLMDLHMPVMDGYETTKYIREVLNYPYLPIVAMTADAQLGVKDKVVASGMNDYIMKPINVLEVYECMSKWLFTEEK